MSMSHWTIQSMGIMIKDPLQIVKLTPPRDDERYELTRHIRYRKSIKAVMRYRGKGLNKEMWFSICSMHFEHQDDCNMCNIGHWQKVWKWKLSSAFYKLFPKLWRWWINK